MNTKTIITKRFSNIANLFCLSLFLSTPYFNTDLNAEDIIILDESTLIEAQKVVENPQLAKSVTIIPKIPESPELKNKIVENSKIEELQKELQKTQSKLHMAEAKSKRLNNLLKNEYNSSLLTYGKKSEVEKERRNFAFKKPVKDYRPISKLKTSSNNDFSVATVIVEKANLRTGPGENNSPIMTVSKGTRLAIETRLDEWYRVITPTGTRAWILSDLISFGRNYRSKPDRTVKIKGYDKDAF